MTDERAILELIDERDIAQASAERLADIIARITGAELGEYTAGLGAPGNDPILNAVDAGESYLRARPAPATEGEVERIGPRARVLVCKGCPAFETEAWREPSGDGETYDSGQYAWCNASGRRSMGAYHYDHNSAPEWCPARAALSAARPSREEMRAALEEFHALWERAQDACDSGGFVEDHIVRGVAEYTNNTNDALPRHLLCDLVEKFGRCARAALQPQQPGAPDA